MKTISKDPGVGSTNFSLQHERYSSHLLFFLQLLCRITCQRGNARQCGNSQMQFKGKNLLFDPSPAQKLPITRKWKLAWFITFRTSTNVPSFIISPIGVPPQRTREIQRCSPFLFIFHCFNNFLRFAHSPNRWTDFHGWWLKTRVLT
jgi:hypothetical protein